MKWVEEDALGIRSSGLTQLVSGRLTLDIAERWDAGLVLGALAGDGTRSIEYAAGVQSSDTCWPRTSGSPGDSTSLASRTGTCRARTTRGPDPTCGSASSSTKPPWDGSKETRDESPDPHALPHARLRCSERRSRPTRPTSAASCSRIWTATGFSTPANRRPGQTLYAKLVVAGSATALQAVPVTIATGTYTLTGVAPGDYDVRIDDNATLSDVTPSGPGTWGFIQPFLGSQSDHGRGLEPDERRLRDGGGAALLVRLRRRQLHAHEHHPGREHGRLDRSAR